jgi:hypothetical protein
MWEYKSIATLKGFCFYLFPLSCKTHFAFSILHSADHDQSSLPFVTCSLLSVQTLSDMCFSRKPAIEDDRKTSQRNQGPYYTYRSADTVPSKRSTPSTSNQIRSVSPARHVGRTPNTRPPSNTSHPNPSNTTNQQIQAQSWRPRCHANLCQLCQDTLNRRLELTRECDLLIRNERNLIEQLRGQRETMYHGLEDRIRADHMRRVNAEEIHNKISEIEGKIAVLEAKRDEKIDQVCAEYKKEHDSPGHRDGGPLIRH